MPSEHGRSGSRRFQINPEPLRVRPERVTEDWDVGRCIATLGGDPDAPRCTRDAKWSVLTSVGELILCTQHKTRWMDDARTMAVEPL